MPEALVGALPPAPTSPDPPPVAARPQRRFGDVLAELARDVDRGQRLIDRALGAGGRLGAAELIALQAGIYRFSESVDLMAKIVDRAGQAVRTTLSGSGG